MSRDYGSGVPEDDSWTNGKGGAWGRGWSLTACVIKVKRAQFAAEIQAALEAFGYSDPMEDLQLACR